MAQVDLPPDLQQKIRNIQGLQAQIQSLTESKLHLEAQLKETILAKESLEKVDADAPIYKSVGGLLIRTTKEKAEKDLKEMEDMLSVRIKKINISLERTQSRFDESREEINRSLKNRMG